MKVEAGAIIVAQVRTYDKITIMCHDTDGNLRELLEHIKGVGNTGHSFSIVVDPDQQSTKKEFEWDGDGADSILKISHEELHGGKELLGPDWNGV